MFSLSTWGGVGVHTGCTGDKIGMVERNGCLSTAQGIECLLHPLHSSIKWYKCSQGAHVTQTIRGNNKVIFIL